MATTHNVSTWNELVAALTNENNTSPVTINIVEDIDCNEDIPLGVASTIEIYQVSGYTIDYTINGNHHVIRNLRTSITSPVNIFACYNMYQSPTITFNDIDWINLVLDKALIHNYGNYNIYNFNNCRFVGRRTASLFSNERANTQINLSSCFMNVAYKPSSSESYPLKKASYLSNDSYLGSSYWYDCDASFCWFRESYDGWELSSGSGYSQTSSMYFFYMTGCYVDGEFVSAGNAGFTITNTYSYDSTIQNVIDATFSYINRSDESTSGFIQAPKGIYRAKFIKYGDPTVEYDSQYIPPSGNLAIAVPDDKMADPAWLYAHGFDIVVPPTP